MPAPRASRSQVVGLLALVLLLAGLLAPAAHAQIVKEKPGRIRAANRRALRESRATELPYKDSHLGVSPNRLKRGESTEPRPPVAHELEYKNGTAPNVQPTSLLNMRRKIASLRPSAQEIKKEKKQ